MSLVAVVSGAPSSIGAVTARRLALLVNNAGASWRATVADGDYDNARRTMAVNFDSVVRLAEAMLPLLRAAAPSA